MHKEESALIYRKDGPFYEMVTSFFVSACGCVSIFSDKHASIYTKDDEVVLSGILTSPLCIKPYDIIQNANSGNIKLESYKVHICSMLLNSAYESVKDLSDQSPEFEFFRHLRNACSHKNRFHFNNNQPNRPSSWRSVNIPEGKGINNPWQGKQCIGDVIGISDALLLLWDIDQRLIE